MTAYVKKWNISALRTSLGAPSLTALATDERVMTRARTLVSYFYFFLPYAAFLYTTNDVATRQNFSPTWPLAWAVFFHLSYLNVLYTVIAAFLCTAILTPLWHRHRTVRVLAFVGVWQAHALESSFGSPNHQWYLLLYTTFIFIFLPDIWGTGGVGQEKGRRFLLGVWTAQTMLMLMYSLAGINKVAYAFVQYAHGEINAFSINGFAYQIADWTMQLQEPAYLAPFIIHHPWVGWLPYVSLIFIQVCALWTMVRPSLQPLWGFLLVAFHIGTYLTMGISFHPLILVVISLLFFSPFAPERFAWRPVLCDLPLIGFILRRLV